MKAYKSKLIVMMALLGTAMSVGCAKPANQWASASEPLGLTVSNRRPIAGVTTIVSAGQYAASNNYHNFNAVGTIAEGMNVLFSASYGSDGGEAGQARGVVVKCDSLQGIGGVKFPEGHLCFQPQENTTSQLLLAPGQSWGNGPSEGALWDLTAYQFLFNQVSLADQRAYTPATNDIWNQVDAYQVDFVGGTAGQQVTYQDSFELNLQKQNPDSSSSKVSAYYAKDMGLVAYDFRETGAVGGTVKVFIGQSGQ